MYSVKKSRLIFEFNAYRGLGFNNMIYIGGERGEEGERGGRWGGRAELGRIEDTF